MPKEFFDAIWDLVWKPIIESISSEKGTLRFKIFGRRIQGVLSETMDNIGFGSSIDNPDVWMRAVPGLQVKHITSILCDILMIFYVLVIMIGRKWEISKII